MQLKGINADITTLKAKKTNEAQINHQQVKNHEEKDSLKFKGALKQDLFVKSTEKN